MLRALKSRSKRLFVQLPKLAFNLSNRSFARGLFLYIKLVYFTFSRQSVLRGEPAKFNFTFKDKKFSLDLFDNLDIAVLVEVFALMEYEWDLGFEPKHILDLGAHWGDTAIYYTLVYPEANILSVEPAPDSYERLVGISKIHTPITPVQAALSEESGEIDLYLFDSSLGNSLVNRKDSDTERVSVRAMTMSQLLEAAGCEKFGLIKFDIEGAEDVLFKLGNLQQYARAYIGEIHLDLMSMSLQEVEEAFSGFEYSITTIGKDRYIVKAIANT